MLRIRLEYLFVILTVFYVVSLIQLKFFPSDSQPTGFDLRQLRYQVNNLESLVQDSRNEIALLQSELDQLGRKEGGRTTAAVTPTVVRWQFQKEPANGPWPHPIAVLIFVCNRPKAIDNHLHKLLKYRPSPEKFPIIVSQDCDDPNVKDVVDKFGSGIQYVKHLSGQKANITVLPGHKRYITYYRISRHYKLGLSYVFDKLNYSSVIVTEDDLDIAPDFFEYFSATRRLLDLDNTLYCVSAWNDNGKRHLIDVGRPELLYRSDFFPGLGWMMTKKLWSELGSIWPDGFWDDWIRNNTVRKDRACIRPEISRTGMTKEGKQGASKGLFFTQHLAKIILNTVVVNFTKFNLEHLLKENYDSAFLERVYSAPLVSMSDLLEGVMSGGNGGGSVRVLYSTLAEYLRIADYLKIMRDFKAGVPRTAYIGVVTCFINGVRIYVAPDRKVWQKYDPKWEAPPSDTDIIA